MLSCLSIHLGAGIKNLQSKDLGNGIRLTWDIVPSCYKVSDISVFLYTDCDKSNPPKEIALPTDRTELELTNLESGKEFCIEVISNSTGDPQAFVDRLTFKTSPAIPIVMIVAVSAGTESNHRLVKMEGGGSFREKNGVSWVISHFLNVRGRYYKFQNLEPIDCGILRK